MFRIRRLLAQEYHWKRCLQLLKTFERRFYNLILWLTVSTETEPVRTRLRNSQENWDFISAREVFPLRPCKKTETQTDLCIVRAAPGAALVLLDDGVTVREVKEEEWVEWFDLTEVDRSAGVPVSVNERWDVLVSRQDEVILLFAFLLFCSWEDSVWARSRALFRTGLTPTGGEPVTSSPSTSLSPSVSSPSCSFDNNNY